MKPNQVFLTISALLSICAVVWIASTRSGLPPDDSSTRSNSDIVKHPTTSDMDVVAPFTGPDQEHSNTAALADTGFSLSKISGIDTPDMAAVTSPESDDFWNEESPDRKYMIRVEADGAKTVVLDANSRQVGSFPYWIKAAGSEYEVVRWAWIDTKTLIGSGWSDLNRQTGVEKRELGDCLLFIYRVGMKDGPEIVQMPPVSAGKVLRIEGVTKQGFLVLAEVAKEHYRRYGRFMDGDRPPEAYAIQGK